MSNKHAVDATSVTASDVSQLEDELALEAMRAELLETWPNHWFAMHRGRLFRSPEIATLWAELLRTGIDPEQVVLDHTKPLALHTHPVP